ncbi:unnamed protein product [Prorocentrum cordatum]|uniref:Uncharacterized protein n=1 Tax=Prorocentrum cordatum TaxID=2364126 RepID=A0ABN9WEM2_9DINO|nr:unnamed protein product [Polarella glacialis]
MFPVSAVRFVDSRPRSVIASCLMWIDVAKILPQCLLFQILGGKIATHEKVFEQLTALIGDLARQSDVSIAKVISATVTQLVDSGVIESQVRLVLAQGMSAPCPGSSSPSASASRGAAARVRALVPPLPAELCSVCGGSFRYVGDDMLPCSCPGAHIDFGRDSESDKGWEP